MSAGNWPDPPPSTSYPDLVLLAENHARQGTEFVEDNRLIDALVELSTAAQIVANVIQLDEAAGTTAASRAVPNQ